MNSNCCKVQHNIPYGPLKHGNITKTAEMAFKFGKHAMFDPNLRFKPLTQQVYQINFRSLPVCNLDSSVHFERSTHRLQRQISLLLNRLFARHYRILYSAVLVNSTYMIGVEN